MKICPQCREEFLESVLHCTDCKESLVDSMGFVEKPSSDLLSKEELFKSEMIPFVEASLSQCREVERILARSCVSCAVYPVSLSASGNETLGTTSDGKYAVLIREADLDAAKQAMEGKFHADVAKEGQGNATGDVIDLEQAEITCPACGERGELDNGDCRVCGLHLGV